MEKIRTKKQEFIAKTHRDKEWDQTLKREMDLLKREENMENFIRI